jgi:uncharacterized protein with PQ loop repeat
MASKAARRRHAHTNIKQQKKHEPFDYVVYFFMVATPLFELPQLLAIYGKRDAENVSLATWAFFCVDNLVWMIYGWRKKEWPVFFTSALYCIMEVAIVIGIVLYS